MGFWTIVKTTFCVSGALALAAGVYALSCWRNPLRLCRACGGAGRRKATFFSGAYHSCNSCGGAGTRNRLGRAIYLRMRSR